MTRHIILWKLNESLSPEEKARVMTDIREGLEGLSGKIPGLLSIRVLTPSLSSSTADLMLDSSFASPEAFALYKEHPAHLEVANGRVRPYVQVRLSFDY